MFLLLCAIFYFLKPFTMQLLNIILMETPKRSLSFLKKVAAYLVHTRHIFKTWFGRMKINRLKLCVWSGPIGSLLSIPGQGADKRIRNGYVYYAIKVIFPWGEGPSRPNDAGGRDLYLWNGDLDLDEIGCHFEIVMVSI